MKHERLLLDITKLEHLGAIEECLVYMDKDSVTGVASLAERVQSCLSGLKTAARWFPITETHHDWHEEPEEGCVLCES